MVIHKRTKLTPQQRKEVYTDYHVHKVRKCDLMRKYRGSRPTIDKILRNSRKQDFSVHPRTNKQAYNDNGTEYRGDADRHAFMLVCKKNGIAQRFTKPKTPQIVSRAHRHKRVDPLRELRQYRKTTQRHCREHTTGTVHCVFLSGGIVNNAEESNIYI